MLTFDLSPSRSRPPTSSPVPECDRIEFHSPLSAHHAAGRVPAQCAVDRAPLSISAAHREVLFLFAIRLSGRKIFLSAPPILSPVFSSALCSLDLFLS